MARSRVKKKRSRPSKERCAVCKEVFGYVTPGHLRTHGFTVERYTRLYGERGPIRSGSVSDPMVAGTRFPPGQPGDENRHRLVTEVAEKLTDDRVWLACIADEVGEAMLNGPLKQRLSMLLTTMLAQRAQVHGQAMAVLSSALGELQEEWRVLQGGRNGGPTDSDTLMRMIEKGSRLVKDSEDAVHRTMKLALDEQRQQAEYADALGPSLYQGTGEKLDMPAGMPTGDRETIRNLLGIIGKAANEEGTIDAEASPSTSTEQAACQGPVDEQRSSTPPEPTPVEAVDPCPAPRRRRRKRRISE